MIQRIKDLWSQLESNSSFIAGLFKIRFSDLSKCDIFLGIKFPEKHRILILKVPFSVGKNFNFKYDFRGLKFEKVYDMEDTNCILLNLVLVDQQFKDVFDTLITDVLTAILNENEVKIILKNYSNRLNNWQSLFERFNPQGLTPEQQRGLFGELYFLKTFILKNADFQYVLNSWIGALKEVRDFQMNDWAIEVKTTHGNNHQKVNISSERQLDITHINKLFLYHLSLEKVQNNGETLNQIVNSIYGILENDTIALNLFKSKLYESGYFEIHFTLYENIGYLIRQDTFYQVENDFPRIQENEIRSGIGDVKYSIILSQCEPYKQTEQFVFENLI